MHLKHRWQRESTHQSKFGKAGHGDQRETWWWMEHSLLPQVIKAKEDPSQGWIWSPINQGHTLKEWHVLQAHSPASLVALAKLQLPIFYHTPRSTKQIHDILILGVTAQLTNLDFPFLVVSTALGEAINKHINTFFILFGFQELSYNWTCFMMSSFLFPYLHPSCHHNNNH